jgi:phenylalanyl-tRNA synthetase beta chain
MKVSRNWLQKYFNTELPSADELAEVLIRHSFEVEGVEQVSKDWVLDIDVLPNRSSDCLSHRGIARELGTVLSLPLKKDPFRENLPTWEESSQLSVTVDDSKLCPRYMTAVVRGVTVGASPLWLREALETLGQKSINNVVDATNYVMLNVGQPLHAFDFSLLAQDDNQKRSIKVRLAEEGEKITTLTGDEYTLKNTHQIIADGISGDPLAIAGIKGGKQAEISSATVDIVLESATFNFVSVRKTSNALKLATDASLRFQNEPSPLLPAFALRDLIELIIELTAGKLMGVSDIYVPQSENMPIDVTLSEINSLLGITLSIDDVEKILVRFEWEFSRDGEEFAITGPWERTDIHIKEDLIEEIGRVYGYVNIVSKPLSTVENPPHINVKQFYIEKIQKSLLEMGYSEVLTYTLVEKGEVELLNPLASDKAFMRTNLSQGIRKALQLNTQNAPLLGLDDVKLFEVGTVFTSKGERTHVAVGIKMLSGKQSKGDAILKSDVEKVLEKIFTTKYDVIIEGGICEIPLDALIVAAPKPSAYDVPLSWDTEARFTQWSAYPFMLRDIAVWVPDGVTSEFVSSVIQSKATDLLVRHDLFDTFEKDGKVSYAWHLVFQSRERTLTDDEMGTIMSAIADELHTHENWEVR